MTSDATVSTVTESSEAAKGKPPVAKQSYGALTVSVFEQDTNDGTRLFHTYTVQRSFRDQAGDWHNSASCRAADSMDHQLCVLWAHRWIRTEGKQRARDFAQRTGTDDTPAEDDVPF